jgi:hypothetical protein
MKSCLQLVFGWRYAGWYLQLSNVKPTQVCSAEAGRQVISTTLAASQISKGIITSILPLIKADRLQEQKRTASQFHYACATDIISQLMFAFTGRNKQGIF